MQTGFEGCILFSSIKSCIQKICSVSLVRKLYSFLCLCFGLGPAPRIFTKLLKIPVSVLRRLSILIIIYLDMLLIGHTIEETLMARDTVLFLLKEISVDTYTENRVLSGDSKFINHDPVSTRKKSLKSSEAVSITSSENTSVDFRINKTNRLVVFNYSSSTSSKKTRGSYCKKVILNRNSKEELQW